jgi:hypothetical protein
MLPHIHDKSDGKVDDDGRSDRQKRGIDEEKPDTGSRNTQFIAQVCTNTKGITFEKLLDFICQSVHTVFTFKLSTRQKVDLSSKNPAHKYKVPAPLYKTMPILIF